MDLNGIHFDLYKFLLVLNGVNKLFFFFTLIIRAWYTRVYSKYTYNETRIDWTIDINFYI